MPPLSRASKLCDQFFSIDFFSMRPSDRITFENQSTFSTLMGKFASWLLIALSVSTFVSFGSNMFYRKNPQSITSQIVAEYPAYLDLAKSGYFMAFGLQDLRNNSVQYIDESVYTVQMIQRTKVGTNITLETIPTSRCSLDRVPDNGDLKEYFAGNQINNLYCADNNSKVENALQSTWDGPIYKNILINIYPCQNSTGTTVCKSPDEIQGYFNFGNYAMYFTNLAINPNNYDQPITTFGKELYTPISYSTLTYIEMLFGHLEFESDNGFLLEELNTTASAQYLSNRQILTYNPTMAVQIDMKLDKVKTIYWRSYSKVQDVLANMGGIIKIFMVLANFFVLPFIKLKFRLNLANTMFKFKTPKNAQDLKKTKMTQKSSFNKKYITPLSMSSSKLKRVASKGGGSSVLSQSVSEYFKQDSDKIEISSTQYYLSCFRNELTKIYKKLFNKGVDQIDKMLDISYIMKKLTEIDMLKALLLDETQSNLFDYIPKPEISLESEEKERKNLTLHKRISKAYARSTSARAKLALEAFQIISKKTERTNIDEKLLDMVKKLKKQQTIITGTKHLHFDRSIENKLFQMKNKEGPVEDHTKNTLKTNETQTLPIRFFKKIIKNELNY